MTSRALILMLPLFCQPSVLWCSGHEVCVDDSGVKAAFSVPSVVTVKSRDVNRFSAANFSRNGHLLLPSEIAITVIARQGLETPGDWVLGRVKVAEGSVQVSHMQFPNTLRGYMLKGRWGDAGDGRFGVYVALMHAKGFWKILVETAFSKDAERTRKADKMLTELATKLAESAVVGSQVCR